MLRQKSLSVKVEPAVLKWAVESSGWAQDELAKKLKINQNSLVGWLKGDSNPTLNQLESLAVSLKRPLAAFFLSAPPVEKPLPKDYRMISGREGKFDKKTHLAIRRGRRLQKISKELSENLNATMTSTIQKASISNNPDQLAQRYRDEFKFNLELQKKLKTPYEVFNYLRDHIEDRNILVFQISMPVDDARGFALVDDVPPVLVVNSKDSIEARNFTLMHEFAHVLLQESGIDMPENELFSSKSEKIERWCNDFASAFLLPESLAKDIFTTHKQALTETETLNKLSRSYKVSKAMLLYNMSKFNFITRSQYDSVLLRFKPKKPELKVKKGGFGASADKKCLSEKGQKFVSLVVSNVEKGFITHRDALNYLAIKSKSLEKVTSKTKK